MSTSFLEIINSLNELRSNKSVLQYHLYEGAKKIDLEENFVRENKNPKNLVARQKYTSNFLVGNNFLLAVLASAMH